MSLVMLFLIISKSFGNAGLFSTGISKLINEVFDNCLVCKTNKKPPPKPVVGLPKATAFIHDKHFWYFHTIDKFSTTTIIKSKSPTIIAKNFLQNRISIFSSSSKVFSDNKGEFVLRLFAKNFNTNYLQHLQNRHGVMEYVSGTMLFWLKSI